MVSPSPELQKRIDINMLTILGEMSSLKKEYTYIVIDTY